MTEKRLTPVRAIRAFCIECCNGDRTEVKLCTRNGGHGTKCPLYDYRMGHRPSNCPDNETFENSELNPDFRAENANLSGEVNV